MKTIKPFGRFIQVKPFKDPSQILGTQELSEYGEVIAIGSDVKRICIGDIVGFSVFGVEKLVINDEEKYYFIKDDDEFLLCHIEE